MVRFFQKIGSPTRQQRPGSDVPRIHANAGCEFGIALVESMGLPLWLLLLSSFIFNDTERLRTLHSSCGDVHILRGDRKPR